MTSLIYNNLFIYSLDTTKNYLHQITKTISDDINALPISRNEIIYMSDLKGINTLYKYDISNNTFKQVTDYYSNILNYDYNNLKFIVPHKNLKYRKYGSRG